LAGLSAFGSDEGPKYRNWSPLQKKGVDKRKHRMATS
jgi:hypothetical protein